MNGYQITFYTQQDRKHQGLPVAQWLMKLAQEMKLSGATLIAASEGMGRDAKLHSIGFFELADQPESVIMVLTPEQSQTLLHRLSTEDIDIFYVKKEVEFGFTKG